MTIRIQTKVMMMYLDLLLRISWMKFRRKMTLMLICSCFGSSCCKCNQFRPNMYKLTSYFRSLVVLGQGFVLLSILLANKCKGVPGSKPCGCQTTPTANAGSSLETDRPINLVRAEAIDLYSTLRNESCCVDDEESGPI